MIQENSPGKLSVSQAEQTLQNVFSACHTRPNTIPIRVFITQQKENKLFFRISTILCVFFLLLTVFAPIPFWVANQKAHEHSLMQGNIYIVDDYLADGIIYLTLSVDLNWEQCYMILQDSTQQAPVSYDEASRKIAFPYTKSDASIYVVAENGTSATIIITPK